MAAVVLENIFTLRADLARMRAAAAAWRAVATVAMATRSTVDSSVGRLANAAAWSSAAANTYHDHRRRLRNDVEDTAEASTEIGAALGRVADGMRDAETLLGRCLQLASAAVQPRITGTRITFEPTTPAQTTTVQEQISQANRIRAGLDSVLAVELLRIEAQRTVLTNVSRHWSTVAGGRSDDWTVPTEVGVPLAVDTGTAYVVNGGRGNEQITVSSDGRTVT